MQDHGYPSTHLFMALTLKITVGCPLSANPSFLVSKKMYTSVELLGPSVLEKKWRAVGTSTRAEACAFTSHPALLPSPSVPDGSDSLSTPRSVSRDTLEGLLRNWHSCWTPWSVFRNSNDGKNQKNGASDWWSGHGHAKCEESLSTRRIGNGAELEGATANSDGKRDTKGGLTFQRSRLWPWVAAATR